MLDDEKAYSRCRGDGVELEQVAGQDRVRLCPEKLRPRGTCSVGRGVDAGCVQELPDGGGADLVAEAGELAVDAAVAPGRVLGGQTEDQGTQAGGDGGSTGLGGLGGPAAGDQLSVPAQDRRRCDEQAEAGASG
jgi:hypothetical protein